MGLLLCEDVSIMIVLVAMTDLGLGTVLILLLVVEVRTNDFPSLLTTNATLGKLITSF